jgi:putative ABC transport system permease protein
VVWDDAEYLRYMPYQDSDTIFLGYSDFESFISSYSEIKDNIQVNSNILIKIDRDRIIDPLNEDTTNFALTRLLTKVHTVSLIKYGIRVENLIDMPLYSYFSWYNSYRIEILAYALPVVAVGFYLGMVGIELAAGQRRRSLGIIKSRGASDQQIFSSLILESVLLGIIAGILGLVLGVFVSRLFLTVIPGSRDIASELDFFRLNISSVSMITAMIFAVLLMLFASIRPAKRISKAPVIESIHQHTDVGSQREYRPAIDIFLVSFAVFAFIVVSQVNIRDLDPAEMGQLFSILIMVLYFISVVWLPFSPFFLMFSLTRLLTRGTSKVYMFFSKMVRPFSKDLWYIIHKNLTRNPKKVSMVSIIIALALGFGIFITTMIGTTIYGDELKVKAQIGGDLKVNTFDANLSFASELENIDGVKDVVEINYFFGDMISGDQWETRKISVFNATKYKQSIDVDEYYFVEGSKNSALNSLRNGKSVIIGENIAQYYSIKVGDIVRIDYPYMARYEGSGEQEELNLSTNNFKVVGVVRALPGLEVPDEDDYDIWGALVYLDFAALNTNISDADAGWEYLINVEKGVDSKVVENAISENFSANVGRIYNMETRLSNIQNDISTSSILFIMLVDIGFMIIIITVGLGLIMFISISERKNEFATIMARGAEAKQMLVIILGEALSISMVGAVVGISSGLFTAYTFNRMISSNNLFGSSGGILSDRPLIIPWYGILVVILALAALLVTSLIAAYRVKRIKLHSALRVRGG